MAWQDRELEWKNLQAVQAKIGEISMIWANTDRRLNEIIADLLDVSEAQTAAVVTGILPSKKCEIIKRLICLGGPNPQWIETMDKIMREISNWGEDRNRLVHDCWQFSEAEIVRIDGRVKMDRKQSRQPKSFEFAKPVPVSLADLDHWCSRGYDFLNQLDDLRPSLVFWMLREREKLSHQQD